MQEDNSYFPPMQDSSYIHGMETVHHFVGRRVRELGLDLAALSRAADKNPTYAQQFVSRGSPRVLSEAVRAKWAPLLRVPEDSLRDPSDPKWIPWAADDQEPYDLERTPLDEDDGNGWHDGWKASVPGGAAEIDVEAGAGEGSVGNVVQIKSGGIKSGHLVVDEWVVPRLHLGRTPQGVIFMPIKGTSMLPVLAPTDVVAVDTTIETVHNGEIYAIDEGGGPSVKRLYVNYDDDPVTVDIISESSAVGRKTRLAESVRVIGRVIGKWSRM